MKKEQYIKINKVLFVLVIIGCFVSTGLQAQQNPIYTQYLFNPSHINPAYIGSTEYFNISMQSRHQWVGFDGAPTTQVISLNKPLPYLKSGIGLSLYNDNIGPGNCAGGTVDYAFHINVTKNSKLGFGLSLGLKYYAYELSDLTSTDDPMFSSDEKTKLLPSFGFGLFYYSDNYYLGISTPELVKNLDVFDKDGETKMIPSSERHYYLMAGYVYSLLNYDIKLKPTLLVKMIPGVPASYDIGLQSIIREKFWIGANYRVGDSFSPIVQVQVGRKLRLAYSYDFTISELKKYNNGTHEIALIYVFSKEPSRIKSPRYF